MKKKFYRRWIAVGLSVLLLCSAGMTAAAQGAQSYEQKAAVTEKTLDFSAGEQEMIQTDTEENSASVESVLKEDASNGVVSEESDSSAESSEEGTTTGSTLIEENPDESSSDEDASNGDTLDEGTSNESASDEEISNEGASNGENLDEDVANGEDSKGDDLNENDLGGDIPDGGASDESASEESTSSEGVSEEDVIDKEDADEEISDSDELLADVSGNDASIGDVSGNDAAVKTPLRAARLATEENVSVEIDGITFSFTLSAEGEKGVACLTDIADPANDMAVTVPEIIRYRTSEDEEEAEYTVTALKWTNPWSSSRQRPHITVLTLPETLTEINGVSFRKFPNLTEVTIPGSVQKFDGLFQYMDKLQKITFAEGVEEISSNMMVADCTALTIIELPESLRVISGPWAFSDAPALTTITLPEGVAVTEGGLFGDCTSLSSVVLPASMTEIPASMFSGCTALESVTSRGSITAVGSYAFDGATALRAISDLSQTTVIGYGAFRDCTALTGPVDLGNVREMGGEAFKNCTSLSGELDLSTLKEVPDEAFCEAGVLSEEGGITAVTFSDELQSIGAYAFASTNLRQVSFPETLQRIGDLAFVNTFLEGTVTIPDSTTEIGDSAFLYTAVEKFVVGSGVTTIKAGTFAGCDNLKEIVIRNSQDNVTVEDGAIPEGVKVTYLYPSIDDGEGDTISPEAGAPTLQEAVNAAVDGTGPDKIVLKKHVKLKEAVRVPEGSPVTITSEEAYIISGTKDGGLKNLFVVEEGASVSFSGQINLYGRYNSGSMILSSGKVTLEEEASVSGGSIRSSWANGNQQAGVGVIDVRGANAGFTMKGGVVENNAIQSGVAYSGMIRISEGASVEIRGGSIRNNNAAEADPLSTSSGILLEGKASGKMTGGEISGNTGRRGSAVMLRGSDEENQTGFVLKGGTIHGNRCLSGTDNVDSSGAVHVENNASFVMEGGSISDNRGGNGAGICVVDGNLQQGKTEYGTEFLMNGGVISGNQAQTGGGIYSYSNGVSLKKGEISGNTASNMGGGIYSEGNYDYYSTLHLSNVLITDNTARQGGGMWFCATGETTVYVEQGAAIIGNRAENSGSSKGVGDDFVFGTRASENHPATLPDRMLGGGKVNWYKDGGVMLAAVGTYPATNERVPRYGTEGADSDPVTVKNHTEYSLALKAVASKEAVALAEREAQLIIRGNHADKGGGIGANGGIIAGTTETTQVAVKKVWVDGKENSRPEIEVELKNGSTVIDSVILNAENEWKHTFSELPVKGANGERYSYTVTEKVPAGYTSEVSGNANTGFVIT
ncbi:MAG: leucine-rich repeat protein, partial [Eubacteriales bacterium]|nr:leucine-rich repeat protein [Eubacteriales bacterium]